MMKQLPGRSAAVGVFVRAYGSWLSASFLRLPGGCALQTCAFSRPLPASPRPAPPGGLCARTGSGHEGCLCSTCLWKCSCPGKLLLSGFFFNVGWKSRKMEERMILTVAPSGWLCCFGSILAKGQNDTEPEDSELEKCWMR